MVFKILGRYIVKPLSLFGPDTVVSRGSRFRTLSKFKTLFKRKTPLESASDEPTSEAGMTTQETSVRHEQDQDGDKTALNSDSTELATPQTVEQQDQETKQFRVWQKGDVILDNYKVEDVKMGGMGYVYIVEHKDWNVKMAIKSPNEMMFSNEALFKRVLREADSWTRLGLHPHIAYCYYVRQIDDIPYIFIEYVDGGNLREWITDMRCHDLEVGLDLAIQFCHGMGYAHEYGMIHRDIKPENILMTKERILKITDFGIVRTRGLKENRLDTGVSDQKSEISDARLTRADTFMGSAGYMPPEQWDDPQNVDIRADIYSFGVCLYEMFCGAKPYELTSTEAKKKGKNPHDPLKLRPDIPPALADLLKKAVALERAERHKSLEELRVELIRIYRDLFHEDPAHAKVEIVGLRADGLNNRAVSYAELGRAEEAIDLWTEALKENPQHLEAAYNRGVVLWRYGGGTDKDLVEHFEMTRFGEKWRAKYLLTLVHLERGDLDLAIPLLEELAQHVPEELEVQSALTLARSGDIVASKCLGVFEEYADEMAPTCLSSDGRYVLSRSNNSDLQIKDVNTGEHLPIFKTRKDPAISRNNDGSYALLWSGLRERMDTFVAQNGSTGQSLRIFDDHKGEVICVSLSEDSRRVLSGSRDRTMRLWDISTRQCLRILRGHTDEVTSVYLSGDGRYALSGSRDNTVRFWDMSTGQCLRTFEGHTNEVTSVTLNEDCHYALSESADNTMRLWKLSLEKADGFPLYLSRSRSHVELTEVEGQAEELLKQAEEALEDGRFADALGLARQARELPGHEYTPQSMKIWGKLSRVCQRTKLRGAWHVKTFEGHAQMVSSVSLNADGRYALSGSFDKTLQFWDNMRSSQRLRTRDWVLDVTLSADGRYALLGSADETLQLWDMFSGECLHIFEGHTGPVYSVSLSRDAHYALSGSRDTTMRLWDVSTGQCLRTYEGHMGSVYSVNLSDDGQSALSGSRDKTMRLWDVSTAECLHIFQGHTDVIYSVNLGPYGWYALSGSKDCTLRLWDGATGQCLRVLEGHTDEVSSVSLSADGRYALSGSFDKSVRFWDTVTGKCLHVLKGHVDSVTSVCLSADGRYALSGSKNGTFRMWNLDWELEPRT